MASLLPAILLAVPAKAADEDLQNSSNPVGLCQGALPVYETSLRSRPLAVTNEGQTPAYVTCAFTTTLDQGGTLPPQIVSYYGAFFANQKSFDQIVTCTGVTGYENGDNTVTTYETQSVTVLANNVPGTPTTGYIFFGDTNLRYQLVAMSCQLPPGVSINDTYVGYKLNDGP